MVTTGWPVLPVQSVCYRKGDRGHAIGSPAARTSVAGVAGRDVSSQEWLLLLTQLSTVWDRSAQGDDTS